MNPCDLDRLGLNASRHGMHFIPFQNSPFEPVFKHGLVQLIERGTGSHFLSRWIPHVPKNTESVHTSVGYGHLVTVFAMMGGAVVVSMGVAAGEWVTWNARQKKKGLPDKGENISQRKSREPSEAKNSH